MQLWATAGLDREPAGGQERARQMSGSGLSQSFAESGNEDLGVSSLMWPEQGGGARKPGCQTESRKKQLGLELKNGRKERFRSSACF